MGILDCLSECDEQAAIDDNPLTGEIRIVR
jgi:hypothetical protein